MDNLGFKIIMFVIICPIIPFICVMLCNEAKVKKNIIIGVTLPYLAQRDERVLAITKRYRRDQWIWCGIGSAILVALIFLGSEGLVIAVICSVALPMVIVPYVIYARANSKLRALKHAEDWSTPYAGSVVVDLKAAATPGKPLSRWLFVPPLLISLAPFFIALASGERSEIIGGAILSGSIVLVCVMCIAFYPLIFRQRSDVVDADSDLNAALTRVRRYNWGKMLLGTMYLTAIFAVALWFAAESELWSLILSAVYTVAIIAFCLTTEFSVRRAQEQLTAGHRSDEYVDEDDLWLWGMFYNNPGDRHLFINDRTGSGMGVNIGRTSGRIFMGAAVLLLVGMAAFGIIMAIGFDAPRTAHISGGVLCYERFTEKYEIPLDDIDSVELLDELPTARRIAGTGMSSLLEGRFTVEGYANVRISLDPREAPFIAIEYDGLTRIFNLATPEETTALYDEILEAAA